MEETIIDSVSVLTFLFPFNVVVCYCVTAQMLQNATVNFSVQRCDLNSKWTFLKNVMVTKYDLTI